MISLTTYSNKPIAVITCYIYELVNGRLALIEKRMVGEAAVFVH